ncbi:transposable element Tcb1 transposase [Trichonephila clavipes]|nr:transposable element Tcb1 transposase [Trichonephila clavipes]
MAGHINRDVILEQPVHLFRGAMGAEFLFMDDNARPHRANIVDECLQYEDITQIVGSSGHEKVPTCGKPGLLRPGRLRGERIEGSCGKHLWTPQ